MAAREAMPELPTGTVTFLFTDVEGSTELVRRLRQRYADVLADQRRLLRAAFSDAGGHEIDTQGDSFFVAFGSARDAVLAAAAAQRSLAAHEWPWEGDLRVGVRMGLHTTEPHLWEEGYVGVGVHRAARISAVGHGGQVLLSRSTAGLVDDEELEGLALRDLGEHRLKSLDRPERIFQLVIDGVENEFPPLDTIEGAGPAAETMTILFTDMTGTTRRVQSLAPTQFRALLAEYHRTLHAILEDTGGLGLDAIADSATAAYRSAGKAVAAAATLLREVAAREWPDAEPLGVGIGLDSGEVIATGHGFFGHAMNRSAELSSLAHGGQILLTDATRSLLDGEHLDALELVELGEYRLSVQSRPIRLHQVLVPELEATFPPLTPDPRPRHQLPT